MNTRQQEKLASIMGKIESLQAEVEDLEERRKLNTRFELSHEDHLYPNAPPYVVDDLES